MNEVKEFIEVKEAAEVLGVCKKTIKNWEKKGFISSVRHPMSNYRLYKREDIQSVLAKIKTL